jgi:hypothetical protein
MPVRRTVPVVLVALSLQAVVLRPASAQNAPAAATRDTTTAASREEFQLGMAAGERGAWEQARVHFERAYALLPRPVTLLDLAAAQAHTGRLLAAAESYRRFHRDAVDGRAAEHRDEASRALDVLTARIPRIRIDARGLRASDGLGLDGDVIAAASVGSELPVDPGVHRVSVVRDGRVLQEAEVRVDERERRVVSMTVPADAIATAASSSPSPAPSAPAATVLAPVHAGPARETSASNRSVAQSPWLWTAIGVVVVGAAVGLGIGLGTARSDPYDLSPRVITAP